MKILFWSIGKANDNYVDAGIKEFTNRISHYYRVEWRLFPPQKFPAKLNEHDLKKAEAAQILNALKPDYVLVTLDEKGIQLTSEKLAAFIQIKANSSTKSLVFLIGGAYGIDEPVLLRSDFVWSLSTLVFPHQLVRLILAEQVYRACTINRNEKYHHT